jgi:diguanylate cyclase (GGDEF)-like protein
LPVAERIHAAITAIRIPALAGDIAVTLSIGITEVGQPTQDESVAQVISRADEAMYAAKRTGRNRSATYLAARPGTGPG